MISRKREGLFTTLPLRVTVLKESELRASVVVRELDGTDELAGDVGIRCVTLGI